jgi:glycosyltransferase involved in cell wall biosynthesis
MKGRGILYLQRKPNKGGAQHSLSRVLAHERIRALAPLLVTEEEGWLTRRCGELGVNHMEIDFPSTRSMTGRFFRNRGFAQTVGKKLRDLGAEPVIVHGNDHHECLLVLALSRTLGAKSALFLRSPGMTRRDYVKHRCREVDLLIAVGDELKERVEGWDPGREVTLVYNGVYRDEIRPPKDRAPSFPGVILVIGSHRDWKGWGDVIEALLILKNEGNLPPLKVHFTGREPTPEENDLVLNRLPGIEFRFLGLQEDFLNLVRRYDLVVNATRMESFGMAAIETLAAGVPLLSSRTGVIEKVQKQGHMLFRPGDPPDLARALRCLMADWDKLDFNLEGCQKILYADFSSDRTVDHLVRAYEKLAGDG